MNKKLLLVLMAFAICLSSLNAANRAPFLITGIMPHYTKDIKIHWDNVELALDEAQKEKLLVVRKDTMTGVMSLKKKIGPLEKKVASEIKVGETPEKLMPLVEKIANLKSNATKFHLACLYRTQNILTKKQLDILNKLSK